MNILCIMLLALPILSQRTDDNFKELQEDRIPLTEEEKQDNLNKFFDDWGNYMTDFNPKDIFGFEVEAGTKKTLTENIIEAPVLFRGAYSASFEDSYKIRVTLSDPNGNVLFDKKHAREAIIHLFLNKTGKYTLIFDNKNVKQVINIQFYSNEELQVSIQISKVNATYGIITEEEEQNSNATYQPIERELSGIEKGLNDVTVQQKFLQRRKERQNRRKYHY